MSHHRCRVTLPVLFAALAVAAATVGLSTVPTAGAASASTTAAGRALSDAFLAEFLAEAATTQRVLERVPADRLGWKPHPSARSLGALAQHVATLLSLVTGFLGEDSIDFAKVDRTETEPASKAVLLERHAASREAGVRYLQANGDEQLGSLWTLKNGGEDALTLPRAAVFRGFLLSHLIHHRGQLTVYLRMLEVPVPSVYGPSRDEMPDFLAGGSGAAAD